MEQDVTKISQLTESVDFANLWTIGTLDDGQGNVTSKKVSLANLLKVIYSVSVTESQEDGGTNVVIFTLLNGTTYTLNVKNGTKGSQGIQGIQGPTGPEGPTGNGISSVEAVSISTENGGHSTYRINLTNGNHFDFDVYNGTLDPTFVPNASKDLESWAARDDSPVESESKALIRSTGGDESINSAGGAKLIAMLCIGADFAPSRIISSGFNLLRLQSNNGLAVKGSGDWWYIPVPKLTATNDSIGTANENNGVLFTDSNGNNLTPTVYFKPLASGVPTSATDGTAATYLDKNGRRHYTTSGPGYLIVSGITWASTCAHLGWSTNYDKYVSPTDADDAGTIVSTTGVGTLRSVGSGGALVSDRCDRTSDSQMLKTVKVGTSSSLTWTNTADVDGEGTPTGTYTHKATISGMLSDGVAEIKVNGGSVFNALTVEGKTVSFQDANSTVAAGYVVKYQLEAPTTSTVSVTTVFSHINDWGIEYVDATGDGNGLWQYVQGIPDAIYGLLGKVKNIEGNVGGFDVRIGSAEDEIVALQEPDYHDINQAKLCGQPMKLFGAGTPQEAVVPDNWIQLADGGYDWNGVPSAIGQEYINTAVTSGGHYIAVRDTNMGLKWYNC